MAIYLENGRDVSKDDISKLQNEIKIVWSCYFFATSKDFKRNWNVL